MDCTISKYESKCHIEINTSVLTFDNKKSWLNYQMNAWEFIWDLNVLQRIKKFICVRGSFLRSVWRKHKLKSWFFYSKSRYFSKRYFFCKVAFGSATIAQRKDTLIWWLACNRRSGVLCTSGWKKNLFIAAKSIGSEKSAGEQWSTRAHADARAGSRMQMHRSRTFNINSVGMDSNSVSRNNLINKVEVKSVYCIHDLQIG